MKAINLISFIILLLSLTVSGEDITLNNPTNNNNCVLGQNVNFSYTPTVEVSSCNLYTNDTGTWSILASNTSAVYNQPNFFYNQEISPGEVLWGIRCVNSTSDDLYSPNYTFILKDVAYCAVLSGTVCPLEPNVNSVAVAQTRLSNTRGFSLENQDCAVWATNSNGNLVKTWDTMTVEQQVTLVLDGSGNWLNTLDKKIPLTDSSGYYTFPFLVERDTFWVGDNYTLHFSCNGIEATCSFIPSKDRLPDMNNYQQLGMDAMGLFLLLIILSYLFFKYAGEVKKRVWR